MRGSSMIRIIFYLFVFVYACNLSPKEKVKTRKEIARYCKKAKKKIKRLEKQARQKSTPKIQRCKRAYSELRYQSCHMKRYREKIYKAALHCKKR